ncbi:hypothetical protein [Microbacterium sp.]|uniref:hypothetical protein n=1 Tax=Microbacterium sp. TaxID=51671 RepID=UPI003A84368F
MPTMRPRHTLTETDDLARALDTAAQLWPECSGDRGALLRRMVAVGAGQVEASAAEQVARRHRALDALAGSVDSGGDPGHRDRLRDEWPE